MMPNTDRGNELSNVVSLILAGVLILFLRNPSAIFTPLMYAEDGTWAGTIYIAGPMTAYRWARPDYLVIGNVALIHMATVINDLIFLGASIDHLPEIIAAVSIVFFAAVAALPTVALRSYLPLWARLTIWAFVLCLPMGTHLNEMVGRLTNAGFAFAFIAAMLALWRLSMPARLFGWRVVILDAGIALCCATNPLSLGIVAMLFGAEVLRGRRRITLNDAFLLICFAGIAYVTYQGLSTPRAVPDATHSAGGLLATAAARPLLYPFMFPVYLGISSNIALGFTSLLMILLLGGWLVSDQKLALGFLIACLLLTSIATAITRPEIQTFLVDYKLSYPDRYFYAQNLLVLVTFVWVVADLASRGAPTLKVFATGALIALCGLYATNPEKIFETRMPAFQISTGPSFAEQLRTATPEPGNPDVILVSTYPQGWMARFPERFRLPPKLP